MDVQTIVITGSYGQILHAWMDTNRWCSYHPINSMHLVDSSAVAMGKRPIACVMLYRFFLSARSLPPCQTTFSKLHQHHYVIFDASTVNIASIFELLFSCYFCRSNIRSRKWFGQRVCEDGTYCDRMRSVFYVRIIHSILTAIHRPA